MESKEISEALAISLDQQDPLRQFRNSFRIPSRAEGPRTYFLGNSLGLQPLSVGENIGAMLDQWATEGVEAFFQGPNPWLEAHHSLTQPLSKVVGAKPQEVVVMNQLSVNIHLMLVSFYRPHGRRNKILMERNAFPSDLYAVTSYLKHLGLQVEDVLLFIDGGGPHNAIAEDLLLSAIDLHADELALVFLGGVHYLTGQLLDMKKITAHAQNKGAIVGFDLAHAAGNVLLELHNWQVDFACWCSYKYLNGGPGAVGGVFIHEKHHHQEQIRLAGWWGNRQDTRFLMEKSFEPELNAAGWQLSTPPIVQYAILKTSLEIIETAGWENMLQKGRLLQEWSLLLVRDLESAGLLKCITPPARGAQLSMVFSSMGKEIYHELFERGFMVDWREPDVIRFAPVPLYNTFSEVWNFYRALQDIVPSKLSMQKHEQK